MDGGESEEFARDKEESRRRYQRDFGLGDGGEDGKGTEELQEEVVHVDDWVRLYQIYGATGIAPWDFTWFEYMSLYKGWRLEKWIFYGQVLLGIYSGLLPRKKGHGHWRLSDFAPDLFKPKKAQEMDGMTMQRIINSFADDDKSAGEEKEKGEEKP